MTRCGCCEECGWRTHYHPRRDRSIHPPCPRCGHCLDVHDRDRTAGEMAAIHLRQPSFWLLVILPSLLLPLGLILGWW
jgi:uncharacterized paraquat-inducible protein A